MIDLQPLACFLIGSESLLVQCAEALLDAGHWVLGIITAEPPVESWASERGIPTIDPKTDYAAVLGAQPFDFLFSVTHLGIIPAAVLGLPRRAAINFHDGPLPRYAGMHTPAWALINREPRYGVSWHIMTPEVDAGDILRQRYFALNDADTSLTLNAKCYEAAIASFTELIGDLATHREVRQPQDMVRRTYFARDQRPAAACTLSWHDSAADLAALVRALDFGPYRNPLGVAKIVAGGQLALVIDVAVDSTERETYEPGTIVRVADDELAVAVADGVVVIRKLLTADGQPLGAADFLRSAGLHPGDRLAALPADTATRLTDLHRSTSRHERFWVRRLAALDSPELPYANRGAAAEPARYATLPMDLPADLDATAVAPAADVVIAAFAAFVARLSGKQVFDIGYRDAGLSTSVTGLENWFATHVPLHVDLAADATLADALRVIESDCERVKARVTYPRDILARHPELKHLTKTTPSVTVVRGDTLDLAAATPGSDLTLLVSEDGATSRWTYRMGTFAEADILRLQRQFATFFRGALASPTQSIATIPLMTAEDLRTVLVEWNDTAHEVAERCVHHLIAQQAALTPDDTAVIFLDQPLSYRELDARANRLAHRLRALGVGPNTLVGVCLERSAELLVAVLAVHKAGGAYVPIDPGYPRERIALMLEDSRARVLITENGVRTRLPLHEATVIAVDGDAESIAREPSSLVDGGALPEDLAYVIYTSGSTGRPKGVMVEHRNVVNFFAGMDQRLGTDRGVWLAVTSLSFDISVLELLWTLTRGFTVVIHADRERGAEPVHATRPIDFSLFYFASDEGEGVDKYRLLLEGAKFGDERGFSAVWTPERHFHAFGGLYPNPAITSAAIAATTSRVQIRAGSVVLPLHHPIRVTEDWSVVDNISRGRVGISFASGWQPNDFVLRPENFADNKKIMTRDIDVVRRLWRGEEIAFPGPKGDVPVRVLPRPVQSELPFWVTSAGNPETFALAGTMGANVLTHLLGQSVEELEDKLSAYRRAWQEAGHPGRGYVSLMLHTFVGESDEQVRETVHRPLVEYLRSSVSLIKAFAWNFPAFKNRPKTGDGGVDLQSLTTEEMDALLEFSFERYYETSGLFGTPDGCVDIVNRLKATDVDDVACLIDFGVESETVLRHLEYLDVVRDRCSRPARTPTVADQSVGALIRRHNVTHMQCTPSMAGMLLLNDDARAALGSLETLLIGGEAFPLSLATELRELVNGPILNMYGPTETTIWSSSYTLDGIRGSVPIGKPIANTAMYVLDANMQPVPVAVPGELFIGGAGVVRGYHGRPELTAERFVPDPFQGNGARLYRTGDLARYRDDGTIEFLGRLDHQVKVRGYRIELGEIEAALSADPSVRETVVVAREDAPGDRRLVAYVVPRDAGAADAHAMRERLRGALPEYMVPSHVILMDAFPQTPNAKVDRKALPAPHEAVAPVAAVFVPPERDVERVIAEIWRELLNIPRVGAQDNFFDLGGHSLLAVQAHRRMRDAIKPDLSITDLFRFPTVRALADFITSSGATDNAKRAEDRAETRRDALRRRMARRDRVVEPHSAAVEERD